MNPSPELIQNTIAGQRKAQLELYQLCFGPLISVARRYKRNEEDQQTLVNNAYIKIVTSLEKYEDKNSFYGWIKRIVMNEVIDDYRRNKKYYEFINQDKAVEKMELVEYSETDYIHSEEELLNMIESLPRATKLVFNLFAIDGYSHKEICEQLGIGEET
ncbi:MAG TPA: sigma-70 family RNA polymerase sigma factor, partial [Flavobacteriales bacterium]|nr:sigma-70 family RNA polymerase sigma factor [Flavobacteriales bacterium]